METRRARAYLVAWKCYQVEPLISVRVVQSPETRIVHILHRTQRFNVHRDLAGLMEHEGEFDKCAQMLHG